MCRRRAIRATGTPVHPVVNRLRVSRSQFAGNRLAAISYRDLRRSILVIALLSPRLKFIELEQGRLAVRGRWHCLSGVAVSFQANPGCWRTATEADNQLISAAIKPPGKRIIRGFQLCKEGYVKWDNTK
jgi:hypothetical protein